MTSRRVLCNKVVYVQKSERRQNIWALNTNTAWINSLFPYRFIFLHKCDSSSHNQCAISFKKRRPHEAHVVVKLLASCRLIDSIVYHLAYVNLLQFAFFKSNSIHSTTHLYPKLCRIQLDRVSSLIADHNSNSFRYHNTKLITMTQFVHSTLNVPCTRRHPGQ